MHRLRPVIQLVILTVFAASITTGCRSIASYAPAADAAGDAGNDGADRDSAPKDSGPDRRVDQRNDAASDGATDLVFPDQGPPPLASWTRVTGAEGANSKFEAADVALLPNGGLAIVGLLTGSVDFGGGPRSASTGSDMAVVVLDAEHRHVWSRNFGGTSLAAATGVGVDSNGDIVLVGSITSATDLGQGQRVPQKTDIAVVKLAGADGAHKWDALFGGPENDFSGRLLIAPDDSIVLVGSFQGVTSNPIALTSAGSTDGLILRLEPDGTPRWARQIGSSGSDGLLAVTASSTGFVVGGWYGGTLTIPPSPTLPAADKTDGLIARLDDMGVVKTMQRFGGAGGAFGTVESVNGVAIDGQDQLWVAGKFDSASFITGGKTFSYLGQGYATYIARLDATNQVSWGATYGNNDHNAPTSLVYAPKAKQIWWTSKAKEALSIDGSPLAASPASGMLLVGHDEKTAAVLLKVKSNRGDQDLSATSIVELPNGYALVGTQQVFWDGQSVQTTVFNREAKAEALAVATNGSSVFVSGVLQGPTDVGAGRELKPDGESDAYLASYALDGGAFRWQVRIGGNGAERAEAVAVEGNLVVVAGSFSGTLPIHNVSAAGGQDIYVAGYDEQSGALQWVRTFGSPLDDSATAVSVDATGVVVTGFMGGANDFGTGYVGDNAGYETLFVAAFDRGGKTRWAKAYRGAGKATARGGGIASAGQDVYVCGSFTVDFPFKSTSHPSKGVVYADAVVFSLDASGNERWVQPFGGSGPETCHGLAFDGQGRVGIAAESTSSDLNVDGIALPGTLLALLGDAVIAVFDVTTGKAEHARRFGAASRSDLALGVSFSAPGQLVVGGRFATSPFVFDGTHSLTVLNETSGFVASIDVPSKTIRWAERVDANASRGSSVAGVAAYPGGVVAVGYASSYQPIWPVVRKRAVVTHRPTP